jgi:hypothetical protein
MASVLTIIIELCITHNMNNMTRKRLFASVPRNKTVTENVNRGGKNRRAREHCSQEMLNSCRKFVSMKICYWKFEGNLNTHIPLWAQQHIVDRHYSLNLKPWSARTLLYVYAHADLAQKYSVALHEICVSSLCSQEENYFFLPWMLIPEKSTLLVNWLTSISSHVP